MIEIICNLKPACTEAFFIPVILLIFFKTLTPLNNLYTVIECHLKTFVLLKINRVAFSKYKINNFG